MTDPTEFTGQLAGLVLDRRRMQERLAVVLRRVGASHPKRKQVNAARAKERRALRQGLRRNADAMAALAMRHFNPQREETP